MLATLRQKFSVDNERIYTTGFSNGTGFSYCLWAERGNTLAAIGAVAGVLAHSERSKLHQPRPLIAIFRTGPHTASDEIKERTINAARKVDNALASEESCDLKFWLLEHSGGFSLPWFLSISSSHNFSTDGCTRIMLFAAGVELQPDTPLFAREEGQP